MIRRCPNGATQTNKVGLSLFIEKQTWGTETSQYPEEEKTIVIPSVVASESGTAQTIAVTAAMGL